ncbi:hypothetical protein OG365_24315 [Streptomyces sp. NBC_00853]|uniref:hypothetical protein n=1 Tax=Streptomyces sp. NBC_00853 TaxID=2903681 RepID=UPI00387358EB|nr:hypothetical protein OG365_24315 [Streptomyces sp. NBC_00853]
MSDASPSDTMRGLGVVQADAPILHQSARHLDLPAERDAAQQVLGDVFAAADRIAEVHAFAKGMGIAAPQIKLLSRAGRTTLQRRGSTLVDAVEALKSGSLCSPKEQPAQLRLRQLRGTGP